MSTKKIQQIDTLIIEPLYNGPPQSANGGYLIGLLGKYLEGSYMSRLFAPPPLDTPMRIMRNEDGSVDVYDGNQIIAHAEQAIFEKPELPQSSMEEAAKGARKYVGLDLTYKYHHCFVCGMARPIADGLHIYAGPIDSSTFGAPWYPLKLHADKEGMILPEFIIGALDCPAGIACMGSPPKLLILGSMWVNIVANAPTGIDYFILSACEKVEGRKHYGSSILYDTNQRLIAYSKSIWISINDFKF